MTFTIPTLREVRIDSKGRRYARSFSGLHIVLDEAARETWDGGSVLVRTERGLIWVHGAELDRNPKEQS